MRRSQILPLSPRIYPGITLPPRRELNPLPVKRRQGLVNKIHLEPVKTICFGKSWKLLSSPKDNMLSAAIITDILPGIFDILTGSENNIITTKYDPNAVNY